MATKDYVEAGHIREPVPDNSNIKLWAGNITELARQIHQLEAQVNATNDSLNDYFRCIASILIWFMQCGFAFLEAGASSGRHSLLSIWLRAWRSASRAASSAAPRYWALHNLSSSEYSHVFLNYVFASTSATIVSGAVAERCEFAAYMFYTVLIAGFAYPIATHWAWSDSGWLRQGANVTYWNGESGVSGFQVGRRLAWCIRDCTGSTPRRGKPRDIRGHSVPVVSLGAFILFFGFFAFNGGSLNHITGKGDGAAAWPPSITLILVRLHSKTWSLLSAVNGALAASARAATATSHGRAVIVGFLAPYFYLAVARLVLKFRVDDPLEAVGVHFGGGLLGLLAVPFLKDGDGLVFGAHPRGGMDLLWQLIGACAISGWSAAASFIIFGVLHLLGMFRVPAEVEEKGLDIPKHGEPAYPLMAYGHGWGERQLSAGAARTRNRDRLFNDMNLPEVGAAIRTIGEGGSEGVGGGSGPPAAT
uniref:Ammonium_transp domain-containing protein n=1 Tax=Macrostomum lignano TaxID=282301 RepID=A0A1I8FI26_9PLAT